MYPPFARICHQAEFCWAFTLCQRMCKVIRIQRWIFFFTSTHSSVADWKTRKWIRGHVSTKAKWRHTGEFCVVVEGGRKAREGDPRGTSQRVSSYKPHRERESLCFTQIGPWNALVETKQFRMTEAKECKGKGRLRLDLGEDTEISCPRSQTGWAIGTRPDCPDLNFIEIQSWKLRFRIPRDLE